MKIQSRLIILLSGTALALIIAALSYLHVQFKDQKFFFASKKASDENIINNVLFYKAENFINATRTNSCWDEMVKFTQTKDTIWAKRITDEIIHTFKLNFLIILNTKKNILFQRNNINKTILFPTNAINILFKDQSTCHFFIEKDTILIEIFGAKIVPASDIELSTPAKGYLLIGKYWDRNYIRSIENSTGFSIHIEEYIRPEPKQIHGTPLLDKYINIYKPLTDWQNKALKYVHFSNINPLYSRLKQTYFLSIFITIFLLLTLFLFLLSIRKRISTPLKIITYSLNNSDIKPLNKISESNNEFGLIARLIKQFYIQKTTLQNEVNERKKAEISLIKAYEELEIKVQERTIDLTKANTELQDEIIERKRAEHALFRSEKNLRTVFNNTYDAIILHNINGQIIEANDQFFKMYNVNPDNFKLFTIKDYSENGELLIDITSEMWKKVMEGENMFFEWKAKRPSNNSVFNTDIALKKIDWYGKDVIMAIIRDISERKEIENIIKQQVVDLESKNAEMERFTYTVSHDLKSPLITIKGFSGSILEDLKGSNLTRVESDIKRIQNAAEKMQQLLDDLLELSRIGRMINPASQFSVTIVANEVVDLLHGIINAKNVNVNVDQNMPNVFADQQRLKEVIQNLMENAIKFFENEPSPTIEIGVKLENNKNIFYVKDNGPGIAPQYHQKIFGLFDKLNPQSDGSGIGLAIVKRIIELHNGKIWVESELTKGATFYFTINENKH